VVQLPVESALYNKLLRRYKSAIELFQLKKLIKKYRPALIHLHVAYGFAKEVVYIKQKWGIPFLLSEHMAPFPFNWIQDLQTFVMLPVQEAEAVVAVSTAQAHQIKEFSGVQPLVIPNVVNEEEFFYAEQQHSDNYLHLVLVGIYDSRKGADYLLQVLPDFLKQHPNTKIHLVGEANPERMNVLQSIIQSRGIKQAVIFHGQLTPGDLCKLYHQCHFYVCASEWESFGLTMLEALFAGLPVLSTNCGGVLEFINAENGLLIVNDRQKKTLLQGMLQMTARLSSFNRKGIAVTASQQFSRNSIKDKYYSLYKQVLQTAGKQSAA
jgi:glycosyltransferase involved in cell wall biosynthesis